MLTLKYVFLLLVLAQVMLAQRKRRPSSGKRFNDNPDFGLPSGRDWPDGRKRRLGAPRPAAQANSVGRNNNGYRPPTQGRRFNDNPDIGLPSGRDWPDGRKRPLAPTPVGSVGKAPVPAPAPAVRPASNNGYRPPAPAVRPANNNGYRPSARGGRFNDNPDFGLPSGRDWPDARRYQAAPVAPRPRAAPALSNNGYRPPVRGGGFNDNPDFGMPNGRDWPDNSRRPMTANAPINSNNGYNSNGYNSNGGYGSGPYAAMALFGGNDKVPPSNNQCTVPKLSKHGQCACCPRNMGCDYGMSPNLMYDECDNGWGMAPVIACCSD